jgi:hypothetical protein
MSFIRRKRVPKNLKEGRKSYFYYYRVESIRSPESKVRQVIRSYLGTADQAIDRLEAEQLEAAELSALRQRLEVLIGNEPA